MMYALTGLVRRDDNGGGQRWRHSRVRDDAEVTTQVRTLRAKRVRISRQVSTLKGE